MLGLLSEPALDFDLAQFGIKPVSDKDVEAEMAKMMAEISNGSSGDMDASDDETELMRQIQQIGVDVHPSSLRAVSLSMGSIHSNDENEDDGELSDSCLDDPHLQAELQGILGTAKNTPSSREDDERLRLQHLVESEKQNAINLKRQGQIHGALEAMRAMKAYEAQLEALGPPVSAPPSQRRRPVAAATSALSPTIDDDDDDHHTIEVTDDDLNNPEFDAMLNGGGASTGKSKAAASATLPQAAAVDVHDNDTVDSVQAQIAALKCEAMALKHANKIPQALAMLKQARAMEPKLVELMQRGHAPPLSPGVPTIPSDTSHANALESRGKQEGPHEMATSCTDSDKEEQEEAGAIHVTDDDLDDPQFDAMLQHIDQGKETERPKSTALDDALDDDIAALKHRVMQLKQANRVPEALAMLKRARAIEANAAADLPPSSADADLPPSSVVGNPDTITLSVDAINKVPTHDDMSSDHVILAETGGSLAVADDNTIEDIALRPRTSSSQLIDEFEEGEGEGEPFHDAVSAPPPPSIMSMQEQVNAAKTLAVALKKQGNIHDALVQLRLAKDLEATLQANSGATLYDQQQRANAFESIEKQLVEFGNECRAQATRLLSIDRGRAQDQLNLHKTYVAALETLRTARADPRQPPPSTHVEERVDMEEHVNVDVPVDRVQLSVLQMRSTSPATTAKDLFVKLLLNVPSQNPHELTTATARGSAAGLYTYNAVSVFPIQRNRGLQKLVELRKAQVEVFTAAGFFTPAQSVGKVTLPLSPLLTAAEIHCWLPVMVNRRPCGLDVQIRIKLNVPLRDKEFRPVKTRVFVVDSYPPTTQQTPATTPPAIPVDVRAIAAAAPPPSTAAKRKASVVSERTTDDDDDDDPHAVDKIVSYDLLEIDIQTGKLTEAMYVDLLNAAIITDTALARSLHHQGRKLDGARVLHRVKVMQQEVASATTTAPPEDAATGTARQMADLKHPFEDKYLDLKDENIALKKKKNEQEDTIKRFDDPQ
ncbi:hypothetical protein DYB34_007749 [Aphanomyces astaci]|uniref:C2 domain-containing protein n=1 Tax=Aphanomyces astaci TaxID=112090 RepID=A0A418C5C5_APHAT|nr:hypothetical protein DYB34_007749 [Aphanomyces astaci]